MLIVDEGHRLSHQGLEVLWDFFQRSHIGLVVLGGSGEGRRLSRHQALAAGCGDWHELHALDEDEGRHLFEERVQQLGWPVEAGAVDAFWDWTRGNFQRMTTTLMSLDYFSHRRVPFVITGEVVREAANRPWTERTALFPHNQNKRDDD